MLSLETPSARAAHYRENLRTVFGATALLYDALWGEHFHLALFEHGGSMEDFDGALERTHLRYLRELEGRRARRILDLACGGGAFSAWLARATQAEVLGIDLNEAQLARASPRAGRRLRFVRHDAMDLGHLDEGRFDAVVCLDAACYFPDKRRAVEGVAGLLAPGGRFLLVDWCRPRHATFLQEALLLEPFYRCWGIPEMNTVEAYEEAFAGAGLKLLGCDDFSDAAAPNWERGYRAANDALAMPPERLARFVEVAAPFGDEGLEIASDQYLAAVLAKAAADAGLLRYVRFLGERRA